MTDAPDGQELDPELIECGRWLFAQECVFVSGAANYDGVPEADLPEIAFVGRSNVGKSSLINALAGRKTLARTSNTPGRTQQINFFRLQDALMLADLPGYGYAKASKTEIKRWTRLIFDYLRGRPSLRRVCLLIDARHGLKDKDIEVMKDLDEAAVSYQIVLTKCDKVKPGALLRLTDSTSSRIAKHVAAHPTIIRTSSLRNEGVEALRAELAMMADIR
ncbi:MAG: YihA family ribosome biogenesis GTP-binding protein [Rhodospirillaceae bacterium TMED63]|nr:YihA family ribosome biogenesis GTP-binding protein [Rhodospirillaceae bacterium]RPF95772.1 MAG: YihA family ribosome biogenesis GTP-binding protein [Rhodospirillaceae bacterium TMED63]